MIDKGVAETVRVGGLMVMMRHENTKVKVVDVMKELCKAGINMLVSDIVETWYSEEFVY